MLSVTMETARDLVWTVHGTLDPDRLTLFSTMRNERAFLDAWLEHHRRIGFEQFLIWDDGSEDGSAAYLATQPDCVVMQSKLGYGDPVRYRDPEGNARVERAGIFFKIALPHVFLPRRFIGYLDADEFLILPPGVSSIAEVIDRLRAEGAPSCVASVVEFFPAGADGLEGPMPETLDGMIGAYPYFEPDPLVVLEPGAQPRLIGDSKTATLFRRYDIRPSIQRRGLQWIYMSKSAKKAQQFQKSPRHKTPIALRSDESRLVGTHTLNLPPSDSVLLTVMHFVFTTQFEGKITRAIARAAHANGASKYRYYAELLRRMRGVPNGFIGPNSVRYTGPEQFVKAGLMRW